MTNNEIYDLVYKLGFEIAKEQSLQLKEIKRITKLNGYLGKCHSDGTIEIYIIPSKTMIERVKIQESVRTICHELAHIKHPNHLLGFWNYQKELCELASKKLNLFIPPEKSEVR